MPGNYYKFIIVLLITAFAAGRFSGPKKVEIKEVEKIVFKDRVKTSENTKIRSERRQTVLPDGTKITEIIRDRDTESKTDTKREGSSEKSKESKTTNQSDWSIGLYSNREVIAGTVDRRILGGVFLGVYGRSELPLSRPEFGLGVRLEF